MYQSYVHMSNPQYAGQHPQQHYHYMYPSAQMPLAPVDFGYSQLMLPANLLSATPSPYVNRHSFLPPVPPLPLFHPRMQPMYAQQQQPSFQKSLSLPMLPYLTQPTTNTSLDQLNLSRTVILKNLSADLSLNDLLTEVDFGPVEYCKMFETPAPDHLKDVLMVKTCYISFVNTHISVSFHYKYARNSYNLRVLRDRLKNSKYLKISLNEPAVASAYGALASNNLSKQDFIKLKTLNYILEFNATRAVVIKFKVGNLDLISSVKDEFRTRCGKYGEIEDFKVSVNDEKLEVKFLVHFTSIDSAIKVYEFHLKRIQIDHLNLLDLEGGDALDLMCVSVNFHRDRCDRTDLNKHRNSNPKSSLANIASSSSSSVASSPASLRKALSRLFPPAPQAYELSAETPSDTVTVSSPALEPEVAEDPLDPELDLEKETAPDAAIFAPRVNQKAYQTSSESNSSNELNSVSSNIPSDSTDPPNGRLRPVYLTQGSEIYAYPSTGSFLMPLPSQPSANSSFVNLSSYQFNPDPFNAGNRTLYLGNLHPNTTVEEIANNVRAGGLVESIKFYRSKRMCFITFIDPAVALKFYLNHQVLHQLIVHGNDVHVSWGKNHSGPLHRDIALAVTAGASRNVYIGIKASKDADRLMCPRLPSEIELREDFSKFGEMEQINFYHNKDCGFMNFMNIADAIKVVEAFDTRTPDKITELVGDDGQFYEKYLQFKISFGKDRCGNPPKFSFKKKNVGFDYYREKEPVEIPKTKSSNVLDDEELVEPISKEAAMVFGISTEPASDPNESPSDDSGKEQFHSAEHLAESTTLETGVEGLPVGEAIELQLDESENGAIASELPIVDVEQLKNGANVLEDAVDEEGNEEDVEEESEDDDDDISIVIEASESESSRPPSRKPRSKPQKIYHNRFDLSDTFNLSWNGSRNTSGMSSNASYAKHYSYHPMNYSPAVAGPQMYYQQAPMPPPFMNSNGYYGGNGKMAQVVQPPYGPGPGGAPQYSLSGSQVMAQYLAKSQHESFVYNPNVYNNEMKHEDLREYRRKPKYSLKR